MAPGERLVDNARVFSSSGATVLFDNRRPRHLPHLTHPEILQMGLSPLGSGRWIETDNDVGSYHRHKLDQRARHGDRVYRATPDSLPAQRELARLLLRHLVEDQAGLYRIENDRLRCEPGGFDVPLDSAEPLWNCSLWVADDLVIMAPRAGTYVLVAASLCSPSHWRLADKFGQPIRAIHDPIPGFHAALSPGIDRFFAHLRVAHPVVRGNWSIQVGDRLDQHPQGAEGPVDPDAPLFYRCERQSLLRLTESGAIAFTIRVYLHPLEALQSFPGALPALFAAFDAAPPALARYKGFDTLAAAFARYRGHELGTASHFPSR